MSNFKSQAKRKRELAKLDKRQAKDQKRALRKAERSGVAVVVAAPAPAIVAVPKAPSLGRFAVAPAAPVAKPLTLEEAVQRWKMSKVAKPKTR
jgi:hypothetical protein